MSRTFRRDLTRRLIDGMSSAAINRGVGPSQRFLLTVVGCKTQTQHTTPVSVVAQGSERYLVGPYGEVGWVRNVRAATDVTLTRAHRAERFSVHQVDAAEAGSILRRYLELEPVTRPYFNVSMDAPAEAFQVEAATHPVFRLQPVSSPQ